jgi:hypothetical protein
VEQKTEIEPESAMTNSNLIDNDYHDDGGKKKALISLPTQERNRRQERSLLVSNPRRRKSFFVESKKFGAFRVSVWSEFDPKSG